MKKKKSLKGMTLVECIIALAVLAISSSVLVTTCIGITKMKISTNSLNKKINYEAPIADGRITASVTDADGNIINSVQDTTGTSSTISLNIAGVTYNATGKTFEVDESGVTTVDISGNPVSKYGTGLVNVGGNHNFKFFVPDANPVTP